MSTFKATHELTFSGITVEVQLSNGALKTKREHDLHLPAEFCWFNGKVCHNGLHGPRVARNALLSTLGAYDSRNVLG